MHVPEEIGRRGRLPSELFRILTSLAIPKFSNSPIGTSLSQTQGKTTPTKTDPMFTAMLLVLLSSLIRRRYRVTLLFVH
jgi:hypothetical protein